MSERTRDEMLREFGADELARLLPPVVAERVNALADRILALESDLADARRENDEMAAVVEAAFVEGQRSMRSDYEFAGVEASYEWEHSDAKASLRAYRALAKEGA